MDFKKIIFSGTQIYSQGEKCHKTCPFPTSSNFPFVLHGTVYDDRSNGYVALRINQSHTHVPICERVKGAICTWNNNAFIIPRHCFGQIWGMGLEKCNSSQINRQIYGYRTGHPWYQHYSFNYVLRLYNVCLHLLCWSKTNVYLGFWWVPTVELSSIGIYL